MKRLLAISALAIAMLAGGKSFAQISIRAGFAPETWKTTSSGSSSTSTTNLNGVFVGAHYNLNLTGDLNVSLGAQYRFNFSTEKETGDLLGITSASIEAKNTQSVIDVPVLLNYGLDLTEGLRLSLFAGATLNFAMAGNTHYTVTGTVLSISKTVESDYDWYGENSDNDPLNLSATFGLNLTYMKFSLFGGYNMGLLDMNKSDNVKTTTGAYFVGLGFNL
ncbi:MAG: outer membrane beta-barrel protein [Bacteroidales bacterium]|nr:outer membrane beta-barrel protein [Bacteroidales bacterium]MBP5395922.1 outer membrane beta-barrel protein [Bacteroidales bacterium]MBP5614460.1 outer membrane beta-barrel protein [Bacteroidales bacterium]